MCLLLCWGTTPHWGSGTPGPMDVGQVPTAPLLLGGGFSDRQSWCVVLLWVLLGVGSLQPALPWSAARLLQSCQPWSRYPAQLLPASLQCSESGLAPLCHRVTSALVLAMVGQAPIISPFRVFQGLLPPAQRQAWLLGALCHLFAPPCASAPAVLGSLLWEMVGQGLGALARAMRSCSPGSRQGAPRTAKACPDPLLLSSRWVPPQAPYLQGQCSLPW